MIAFGANKYGHRQPGKISFSAKPLRSERIRIFSYYDATNGQLKYTRASDPDGLNWNNPAPGVVDALGTVGEYTSLLVVNSNPAIAYYDPGNGALKYALSTTPTFIRLQKFSAITPLSDSSTIVTLAGMFFILLFVTWATLWLNGRPLK